jgi:hypothetical protein
MLATAAPTSRAWLTATRTFASSKGGLIGAHGDGIDAVADDLLHRHVGQAGHGRDLVGGDDRHGIQFARLEPRGARRPLGNHLENDLVEIGFAGLPVVGVLLQHDLAPGVPANEPVGSGADRVAGEIHAMLFDGRLGNDVAGGDGRHVAEEGARFIERDGHRQIVRRRNGVDGVVHPGDRGGDFRIADTCDGGEDIGASHRRSVVEGDALAQVVDVVQRVGLLPALGQERL